jgi:hypothetical protein
VCIALGLEEQESNLCVPFAAAISKQSTGTCPPAQIGYSIELPACRCVSCSAQRDTSEAARAGWVQPWKAVCEEQMRSDSTRMARQHLCSSLQPKVLDARRKMLHFVGLDCSATSHDMMRPTPQPLRTTATIFLKLNCAASHSSQDLWLRRLTIEGLNRG